MKIVKYSLSFFILITLFSSCKKEPLCTGDAGDEIRCYYSPYGGRNYATYCSKKDSPPCDCKDESGQLRDIQALFVLSCSGYQDGGSNQNPNALVKEPYEFPCSPGIQGICPQYDPLYIDASLTTNDNVIRPDYFNFSIPGFDIRTTDYEFFVRKFGTTAKLMTKLLTSSTMDKLIRKADPYDGCLDKVCDLKAAIVLNVSTINKPDLYEVVMESVVRSTGARKTLATKTFGVETQSPNGSSKARILNFATLKNGQYDLSSYILGSRPFGNDLLNYVFGDAKSNIDFNSQALSLTSEFVTPLGYLKLSHLKFTTGDLSVDIVEGLHDWVQQMFQSLPKSPLTYQGFITEAFSVEKWDLINKQSIFVADIDEAMSYTGITLTPRPTYYEGGYDGAIAFRKKAANKISVLGLTSQLSTNEMSLYVILHELGHVWSPAATPNMINDCERHSYYCTGQNRLRCFWQLSCILEGANTEYTEKDFILRHKQDPVFCEGHQQYFMNQLTVK